VLQAALASWRKIPGQWAAFDDCVAHIPEASHKVAHAEP
jgi:hypothetical protein